ncbi:MAG: hypothetical protein HY671_05825 [Chloroflexi bacterium]|nr:hypothetical protein [Chloroflexota bacterium]
MTIPFILIAIGAVWLLVKLGVLTGSIWGYTWPVLLIVLGLSWLLGSFRHHRHHMWWCCGPGEHDEGKAGQS